LFIGENLLGQLDITFSALGTHIIAQDGLSIAWRFGETDVSWDYGSKDLALEEASQVVGDLAG
jgi:hypothetical protein